MCVCSTPHNCRLNQSACTDQRTLTPPTFHVSDIELSRNRPGAAADVVDDLPRLVLDVIQQWHGRRDVTDAGGAAVGVGDAVGVVAVAAAKAGLYRVRGPEI